MHFSGNDTLACLVHLQVAVHDLCLGVRSGERFGLLGPNGAGAVSSLCALLRYNHRFPA